MVLKRLLCIKNIHSWIASLFSENACLDDLLTCVGIVSSLLHCDPKNELAIIKAALQVRD